MINRLRKIAGFTLVELILAILIVGAIAGVSAKILLSGIDTYEFITTRKNATQNARVAMERMVDELVLLKQWTIDSMAENKISFFDYTSTYASFKTDTFNGEPAILRGEDFLAGPSGLLDFDYLAEDDTNTASTWDVRKINIELQIDAEGGNGSITLRTEVYPRENMYSDFERVIN